MPNIESAKKRARQSITRKNKNLARKTAVKTAIKKVMLALKTEDVENAKKLMVEAEAKIARAKTKGLLHKNTASRSISRLAKRVSAASKPKEAAAPVAAKTKSPKAK